MRTSAQDLSCNACRRSVRWVWAARLVDLRPALSQGARNNPSWYNIWIRCELLCPDVPKHIFRCGFISGCGFDMLWLFSNEVRLAPSSSHWFVLTPTAPQGLARSWPPSVVVVSGNELQRMLKSRGMLSQRVPWCGQRMSEDKSCLFCGCWKGWSEQERFIRGPTAQVVPGSSEVFFAGDLRLRRMLLVGLLRLICQWHLGLGEVDGGGTEGPKNERDDLKT